MTHRVYKSASIDSRLVAQKCRPHGRQGNVRRCWKLRYVDHVLPGAFLSDHPGEVIVGRLRTVRGGR